VGLALVRGRAFAAGDGAPGRDVAIVNQRFASMYLAGRDPIGSRIALRSEAAAAAEPAWLTIVGVAPTVRQRNLREFEPDPVVYVPCRAAPAPAMTLLVRTTGEPTAVTSTVREQVRVLDPDLPLFGVATLDETLAQSRSFYRIFGTMFSTFAIVALVLSAVGLYGMTAWSVIQRTREIGIRIALGAHRATVVRMVMRQGLAVALAGLIVGCLLAVATARAIAGVLYGITPADPVSWLVAAATLMAVAAIANVIPAARAARVQPTQALRTE
jgi:putative ABC transport system permease protein